MMIDEDGEVISVEDVQLDVLSPIEVLAVA